MCDPTKGIDDSATDNIEDPVYLEDFEDFKAPKKARYSRVAALTFGFLALVSIGIGIYFFLHRNGYKFRKDRLQHEDFQGSVSSEAMAEHNTPDDCWLALHGKVYDLTEYAPLHPGPPTLITMHCGTDATLAFDSEHPLSYLPIVDQYLLGTWTKGEVVVETEVETQAPSVAAPISPTAVAVVTDGCEMQRYTLAEVAEHNDETSCWYSLYGVIYDFTEYMDLHPGGAGTILMACGTLATEMFESIDKHNVDLLLNGGFSTNIIGRQGDTSGVEIVPCDEVDLVSVSLAGGDEVNTPAPSEAAVVTDGCEMQRYTLAEVAEHMDETSCWYSLYGVIYDFTDYMDLHPGGAGTILMACGTVATELFESIDKHNVDLLLNGGFSSYIIGREGSTSGIEIVPCDEVDLVAVSTNTTMETPEVSTAAPSEAEGCQMQRYTLAEVAEHSDDTSCWYSLYGVIYDFTDYMDLHPGGSGTILMACGTVATELFESIDKHNVDLLLNGGFSSYIIGREGSTSDIESVPCDEVDLVAVDIGRRK